MINPIDNPEAYFKFLIGALESPGVVVATDGFDAEWKWDEKAGKGTKKASVTHTGQKLSSGTFTCALWLPDHFDYWETYVRVIGYDTDKRAASAHKLYYPTVSATGVRDVVTTKCTSPVHAGKGLYKVSFSFTEWVPAPKKNATVTPAGPKPVGQGALAGGFAGALAGISGGGDPIADAQQAQIAALLAEARKP